MNEDEIAVEKFADDLPHDDRIDKYISTFAGHVTVGDYRAQGAAAVEAWIRSIVHDQM